jgi:hypothetical protein
MKVSNKKESCVGLQKFTNSELAKKLPTNIETVLAEIIEADKWCLQDIWDLTEDQKKKIQAVLTAGFLTLADEDREQFMDNTEPVLSTKSRNEIWERNHYCILNVISWQTIQHRQIPTIKDIAEETGLSRVTVIKHLKEYYDILAKIYSYAYDGNMKAAKIFMDATTEPDESNFANQQNNYIQFNNIRITAEQLNQLPIEKQQQLQSIFTSTK